MGSAVFGYLAAFFAFLFYLGIIRAMLNGTSRPSRATWIIWALNDFLLLAGSFVAGAWNTLWVPLVYSVCGLFCAAASIRNDAKPLSLLDKLCLGTSIAAWMVLFRSRENALLSLILGVAVNTIGAFPTWAKLVRNPGTEQSLPWLLVFMSSVCQLIALEQWRVELALFPVDSFVVSGTTLLLSLRRRR